MNIESLTSLTSLQDVVLCGFCWSPKFDHFEIFLVIDFHAPMTVQICRKSRIILASLQRMSYETCCTNLAAKLIFFYNSLRSGWQFCSLVMKCLHFTTCCINNSMLQSMGGCCSTLLVIFYYFSMQSNNKILLELYKLKTARKIHCYLIGSEL